MKEELLKWKKEVWEVCPNFRIGWKILILILGFPFVVLLWLFGYLNWIFIKSRD